MEHKPRKNRLKMTENLAWKIFLITPCPIPVAADPYFPIQSRLSGHISPLRDGSQSRSLLSLPPIICYLPPFTLPFSKSPHFALMPQFDHNHSINSSHILNPTLIFLFFAFFFAFFTSSPSCPSTTLPTLSNPHPHLTLCLPICRCKVFTGPVEDQGHASAGRSSVWPSQLIAELHFFSIMLYWNFQ